MNVISLGYVGVDASELDPWASFFDSLIGAEVEQVDEQTVAVRVDSWARRFLVSQGKADDVAFIGWEVADARALEQLVDRLAEFDPTPLDAAELELRQVEAGAWVLDPAGVRTELFHGPTQVGEFHSAIETDFVTGALGLGHVVLSVDDVARSQEFYEGRLGFRLSDSASLGGTDIAFLRCNPRHHSLAVVETKNEKHAEHLMLQVADLDSVGRACDRCRAADAAQSTIGRHSNDHMFSFYAMTPSGFTFEYGWGGQEIHGGPHQPSVFQRESTWGHENLIEH